MGDLITETPYSEITATLEVLDRYGITRRHLTRLRAEPDLAKRVAKFMISGCFKPTVNQKRARVMGKNMFGVEEATKHFGVKPTRAELSALSEIPFSEEVLQEAKDTHILVAIFPLSIIEIRERVDSKLFYDQSWYNKQSFAKERGETSWQLVRKTPVDNSTSKNWEEQLALIGEEDEVPTAQVMVYTIIGHYLATAERLFEHIYVRTSSVASAGARVSVGSFDSLGLDVYRYWDGSRLDGLGVSSARKF